MPSRFIYLIAISSILLGLGLGTSDNLSINGIENNFEENLDNYRFSEKDEKDYNIVVISVDTLRSDHLTCYGYDRNVSYNMCNKYGEPVVFENTYSQAPWSLSSFTSMLSGKWPFNHGVRSVKPIPDTVTLIQEVLSSEDYQTAAYIDGGMLRPHSKFHIGFDDYLDVASGDGEIGNNRELFNKGLEFMESTDEKKFLFFNSMEVHRPYRPKNLTVFEKYAPENLNSSINVRNERLEDPTEYRKENLTQEEIEHVKAGYDTSIKQTDKEIGRFMDKLKNKGKLNDTIVIITSDHGESFQEHIQYIGHTNHLYEEFIKVPLIIHHPDIEGRRIESRTRLVDIAPTIADFSNLNTENLEFDGESLTSLMKGSSNRNQPEEERIVYSSTYGVNGDRLNMTTLIRENWKLIWDRESDETELYNIREDPEERNDLSANKPDLVDELKKEILEMKTAEENQREELEEPIKQRLKNLGYRQ